MRSLRSGAGHRRTNETTKHCCMAQLQSSPALSSADNWVLHGSIQMQGGLHTHTSRVERCGWWLPLLATPRHTKCGYSCACRVAMMTRECVDDRPGHWPCWLATLFQSCQCNCGTPTAQGGTHRQKQEGNLSCQLSLGDKTLRDQFVEDDKPGTGRPTAPVLGMQASCDWAGL
jgi:hypothetical protein